MGSPTAGTPDATGPLIPLATGVARAARAYPPELTDVAIVGDSLTVGAQPFLPDAFSGIGSRIEFLMARNGIPTSLGLSYLRTAEIDLPPTVILALGTNDVNATDADVVGWLVAAREIIGPQRRLVWVNLDISNSEYSNDEVFNRVLAQSVTRDPRILVLDWAAYAHDNRIGHAVDGVHYDTDGYRQRAGFYRCAVWDNPTCERYQLHG